jgi:hypothetical protein
MQRLAQLNVLQVSALHGKLQQVHEAGLRWVV